jgi:hypothetical protein
LNCTSATATEEEKQHAIVSVELSMCHVQNWLYILEINGSKKEMLQKNISAL